MLLADWIEHVLATGGDQYLKTPEHLLPWHARHMLDVYALLLAAAAFCTWAGISAASGLLGWRRARVLRERKVTPGWGAAAAVDCWGGLIRPGVAAGSAALAAGLVLAAAGS